EQEHGKERDNRDARARAPPLFAASASPPDRRDSEDQREPRGQQKADGAGFREGLDVTAARVVAHRETSVLQRDEVRKTPGEAPHSAALDRVLEEELSRRTPEGGAGRNPELQRY